MEARARALQILALTDPLAKAAAARALDEAAPLDPDAILAEPAGIPGRPERPLLVGHLQLKPPSMRTPAGIAALVHAIAHIEFNAIKTSLMIDKRALLETSLTPDRLIGHDVGHEHAAHQALDVLAPPALDGPVRAGAAPGQDRKSVV